MNAVMKIAMTSLIYNYPFLRSFLTDTQIVIGNTRLNRYTISRNTQVLTDIHVLMNIPNVFIDINLIFGYKYY